MTDDIWIVCENPSHPTKTARIARMTKDARGWHDMGFVLAKDALAARDETRAIREQHIKGRGVPVIPKRTKSDDTFERPKLNLRCDLCGYELRAVIERLAPVLDTLAESGVSRITLRALDARFQ